MHYETKHDGKSMGGRHHHGRGFGGGHGWQGGHGWHGEGHQHHPDGPQGMGGGGFGRGRGPFGGGGFNGGPGFGGPRDRARRGEAKYVLLDVLRDGPKHGYEIIKALEEKSGGQYVPSPGTVYPTMQFLEDQGLVRADRESDRRIYHLTDAGKAELEAQAEALAAFWSRFSAVPDASVNRAELQFLLDAMQDLKRTVWRGLQGVDDPAKVGRVRKALEQCQNTVREILVEAGSGEEA